MTSDQFATIVNIIALLAVLFAGGSVVVTGGLLASVVLLVRAVRNDKALETAIEKLYQSAPVGVQGTIKEVGDLATSVGSLIGDVTALPNATAIPPKTGNPAGA